MWRGDKLSWLLIWQAERKFMDGNWGNERLGW